MNRVQALMPWCLLLLAGLEIWLFTWATEFPKPFVYPILLLATSTLLALLYYFSPRSTVAHQPTPKVIRMALWLLVLVTVGYVVLQCRQWFATSLLSAHNPSQSDVLPTVMQIQEKLKTGKFIYTPIHFPNYSLPTTYLPAMWLPFTPMEWLHKDYRWAPIACMLIALLVYVSRATSSRYAYPNWLINIVVAILPLVAWYCMVRQDHGLILHTIESVPAAYYLLFGLALLKRNWIWAGVFLGLCLLSRFSILLFVPVMAVVLFVNNRKRFWQLSLPSLAVVLLLYVLPFLSKDPTIFSQAYKYYTKAAIGEWSWAVHQNGFWHMGNGLGFTKYMLHFAQGWPVEKMVLVYQKIQQVVLAIFIVTVCGYFWKNRQRVDEKKFLLAALKIYFALFYAFVQVPYKYLFLVPIVFTSVLILDYFSTEKLSSGAELSTENPLRKSAASAGT